jgi:hypothetical protein
MCPECIATLAWIGAGATSTGGIAALVVSRLRGKNNEKDIDNKGERNACAEGENSDDEAHDRDT